MNRSTTGPTLAQKLGVLGAGILGVAIFVLYPMYRAANGATSMFVSYSAIFLTTMLLGVGFNLLLLGDKGIRWKKTKQESLTPFQKLVIGATVAVAVAVTALVWMFLHNHGYQGGI